MSIDAPDLGMLRLVGGGSMPRAGQGSSRSDFASIMGVADRGVGAHGNEPVDAAAKAKKVAEEFVAKVFIEPMLKQARDTNKEPPPFGPGQGEKQFSSLIDAQRSLDLVRSASWPIVDRLASDMTRAAEAREG